MSVIDPVGVALVGIGGHAVTHVSALRHLRQQGLAQLVAAVEANPSAWARELNDLRAEGVVIEPDLPTLLANQKSAVSLVGVPVGIPAHRRVTEEALRAGYHVVLEKPPVGCIDDLEPLLNASRQSGKTCAVHFQSIWLKSLRGVKAAILAGKIGALKEIRIKGRWFREDKYYTRNRWAGRLRVDGAWVLDGTINNPFAHQVNNALFLAGESEHSWANPTEVRAELYHARPGIFGDDTSCLAVRTDRGVDLRLWLTLCSETPEAQPKIRAIGQKGEIAWPMPDGSARIVAAGGQEETIPPDTTPASVAVYSNVCRWLQGQEERVLCTLADTRPFVQTVSAACEAAGPPQQILGRFVRRVGEPAKPGFVINGIDEAIDRGFETGAMLSEMNLPWTKNAATIRLGPDYTRFRPKWAS